MPGRDASAATVATLIQLNGTPSVAGGTTLSDAAREAIRLPANEVSFSVPRRFGRLSPNANVGAYRFPNHRNV